MGREQDSGDTHTHTEREREREWLQMRDGVGNKIGCWIQKAKSLRWPL